MRTSCGCGISVRGGSASIISCIDRRIGYTKRKRRRRNLCVRITAIAIHPIATTLLLLLLAHSSSSPFQCGRIKLLAEALLAPSHPAIISSRGINWLSYIRQHEQNGLLISDALFMSATVADKSTSTTQIKGQSTTASTNNNVKKFLMSGKLFLYRDQACEIILSYKLRLKDKGKFKYNFY